MRIAAAPLLALGALALCHIGCGARAVQFDADAGAWPARPSLPWAHEARLAVTNNNDDTVTFVSLDLPTPMVRAALPVGDLPVEIEGPHDLAAPTSGEFIYVVISNYAPGSGSGPHGAHGLGTTPGTLQKFRASDMSLVGEAPLRANAGEIVLTRDGSTAYVTHYDLAGLMQQVQTQQPDATGYSTIAIVDTATLANPTFVPVCATTHDMQLSDDEKTLYTTCQQSDQLAIVDLATRNVTLVPVGPAPGRPLAPAYQPYAVRHAAADGSLWISCFSSAEVRVYDPKTGKMDPTRTVQLSGQPVLGAFLSDGKTLLTATQGTDEISVIDTEHSLLTSTIPLPPQSCLNARNVVVTPGDQIVYVVCEGDQVTRKGSVVAVDVKARQVLGFVEAGLYSDAMILLPSAL